MKKTRFLAAGIAFAALSLSAHAQFGMNGTRVDNETYTEELNNAEAALVAVGAFEDPDSFTHPYDAKQLRQYIAEMLWLESQPAGEEADKKAEDTLIQERIEWCNKWMADYEANPEARGKADRDASNQHLLEETRKMARDANCKRLEGEEKVKQ